MEYEASTSIPVADCSPMLTKLVLTDCNGPRVVPGSGALRTQTVLFCTSQELLYRKANGASSILFSWVISQ
jgi:hypothetical protein